MLEGLGPRAAVAALVGREAGLAVVVGLPEPIALGAGRRRRCRRPRRACRPVERAGGRCGGALFAGGFGLRTRRTLARLACRGLAALGVGQLELPGVDARRAGLVALGDD